MSYTISQINPNYLEHNVQLKGITYEAVLYCEVENAELDEMWSFVQSKKNQRWLWLALNHDNKEIIAYTFGRRQDKVFLAFKEMLEPLGITMYYTDDWGSYKHIPDNQHTLGKKNTQAIERTNLTLRTRIKRLARKTICFSKSVFMHDTVIGLVINILAFDWMFFHSINVFRT